MSTKPRLIAFDLDDTLAQSKSPVSPIIADLLRQLLRNHEVCVISGGNYPQFESQLLGSLDNLDDELLSKLHLMPTCGTQYYRYTGGEWSQIYEERLSPEEASAATRALEVSARELGFWEARTWGTVIEDRGSQITFSALGQQAPIEAKKLWDADGRKKARLRDRVAEALPELEVRSGGSTSIDITRKGIDKAYGIRRLVEHSGIGLEDILFVGDRLDEGGNDYPVLALGVLCHAVEGWEDTAQFLSDYLANDLVPERVGPSAPDLV
ncbi:HAD-IIB family hydrolase [Lysinibacter sp. HNR]|uniref:HAD-IIB family hydrolase n=1 Tax=Lysinibacter sp. HNR TaxID=3031408 RepID=UPI0024349BC5|nr:HAD-IIB family hydrolase [Lysinibacter sp. HNR]WGD38659.1 HAD-IIB family hydrolase [Lysinibacter sp. HNR]